MHVLRRFGGAKPPPPANSAYGVGFVGGDVI